MTSRKKKKRPVKGKRIVKKKYTIQKQDAIDWKIIGAILLLTIIAFLPVLQADFVNWDDDYNLLKNPNLQAFDWANIKGIFTTQVIGNYNPLPIFTFAIEKALFGLDPFVYHLNNLLLHLICVFFVYRIPRGLGFNRWAAGAIAVLFAIHPMRVESVAWVTERKDVLFGAFYLAGLYQYIKYHKLNRKKKYLYFALILFGISLFAKIQAVTFPLSCLAIDYYLKRPLKLNLVWEKIPMFLMSLAFGLIGVFALQDQGSIQNAADYSFFERLMVGGYSLGVYILKWIFPYKMSPLYPYPPTLPWYVYLAPVWVLAILGTTYLAHKKDWKIIVFGVSFFIFNVMFLLQIVGAGQGFLADRFTYIPFLGLFFIMAYYWDQWRSKSEQQHKIAIGVGALYLAIFAIMTFQQNKVWEDSGKLWTHVTKYHDNTPLPFRNRANFYRDEGMVEEALADYGKSLELKEEDAVYNSRAKLYFNQKKYRNAIQDYSKAIELNGNVPDASEYWINRGASYAAIGNLNKALQDMNRGLELDANNANGYMNRSLIYQNQGNVTLALQDITQYLTLNPYHADLWYESGRLKNGQGQYQSALNDLNRAIQLNNNRGPYYAERAVSHQKLGNGPQANADKNKARSLGVNVQ